MKKRVLHLGVASFLALLPALVDAQATNPPYLSQMPSVEQVMGGIKGADAMDTAARRMGAFWQLQKIVEALGNPRRSRAQLTPDEGRLIGQYRYGYSLAGQPFAHIDKDPSHPDRPKWFEKHSFYETDDAFLDLLLRQFFSPEFQAGYYRSVNREPPQSKSVQSVAANNRPQPSAPGATAGTYLAQAEKHRQARDFVRAIEAYRQALAIERSAVGYLGLGVAYAGQGENQLAVSALKQGLDLKKSLNTADADILITLGRSQGNLRQYADGLESCRRAIQLQPNADVLARAHRCLGRVYGESGQRDNAIAAFKEAIRVYPDDANAHFELASAYTRAAQYQNAVASYKQAIRLSPNEPEGHYSLGLIYVLMGSRGEALQVYRTLQKLDMELAKELAAEINRMK